MGEPAAGAEGFGRDDTRTSIFDYWSMPELVRWVNDHKYDGSRLSAEQKALRAFYAQLVNVTAEPAFRDGAFYPLNPENRDNPSFGRIADETVSGHWCYSFLRFDRVVGQRFLVLINLHPQLSLHDVRVVIPPTGVAFLELTEDEPDLHFTDRLASERPLSSDCTLQEISSAGISIPEIAPLSAYYFECSANPF